MKFKVIEKATGKPIEADDYAERYWAEQRWQEKVHPMENRLPYLFYRKCDWLVDSEGDLHIQDSCGNVVVMDNERFEAVSYYAQYTESECAKWETIARSILLNTEAPHAQDRSQLVVVIETTRNLLNGRLSETQAVPT